MWAKITAAWKIFQAVIFIYKYWERAIAIAKSEKEINEKLKNPNRSQAASDIADMF